MLEDFINVEYGWLNVNIIGMNLFLFFILSECKYMYQQITSKPNKAQRAYVKVVRDSPAFTHKIPNKAFHSLLF